MRRHRLRPLPALVAAALLAGAQPGGAQEYRAQAGIQASYSDEDITPDAPAHVEGDTSPGNVWIRYDVTTGRGAIDTWHQLYSCCVSNASAAGSFELEDLVFASPGGTGGTADVTLNFTVAASANQEGSSLRVQAALGGGIVTVGTWIAGPQASSGVFTGYDDTSLSGTFTSQVFTVPLDVPVTFFFSTGTGTGSYQVVSAVQSQVTFPVPGSGVPVFNIVSGPDGITVSSAQGDIVDNLWGGDGAVAVSEDPGARSGLRLAAPTPNPSRGAVSLALSLPDEAPVSLRVYDIRGGLVEVVEDGTLSRGQHRLEWNPRPSVPAGIYFVRLRALGEQRVQRAVLVR